MSDARALALMAGGLATAVVARSAVVPGEWHFTFNLAIAGFSVAVARLAGLDADELGCAPRRLGAGLRYGGAAFLAVTAAVAGAAPFGVLDDDRTAVSAGDMLLKVLVIIPVGTVLVEELAFRGTLHGLLDRTTTAARSMAIGAVLFGLWHVPPIVGDGLLVVAGTVAATTAAGVAFIWLRRRSSSLLAPVLAHLATNSATFALSWAATR